MDGDWTDVQGRVTWSINPANKVAATIGDQRRCLCPGGASPTRAVEAGGNDRNPLQRTYQAEWQSTLSSRLVVEIGIQRREIEQGFYPLTAETSGVDAERFANYPQMIGVTVNNGQGIVANNLQWHGPGPAENFSGGGPFTFSRRPTFSYRASAAYETGRHLVKAGIQDMSGYSDQRSYSITVDRYGRPVRYEFSTMNTPQSVTVFSGTLDAPWFVRNDLDHDRGIYIQDQFMVGRATILGGLRLDLFKSSYPGQSIPKTVFGRPAATFAGGTNLGLEGLDTATGCSIRRHQRWKDGAQGDAEQVRAESVARGPGDQRESAHGWPRHSQHFSRRWLDVNGDFVVDCEVSDPQPNLECTNAIRRPS